MQRIQVLCDGFEIDRQVLIFGLRIELDVIAEPVRDAGWQWHRPLIGVHNGNHKIYCQTVLMCPMRLDLSSTAPPRFAVKEPFSWRSSFQRFVRRFNYCGNFGMDISATEHDADIAVGAKVGS